MSIFGYGYLGELAWRGEPEFEDFESEKEALIKVPVGSGDRERIYALYPNAKTEELPSEMLGKVIEKFQATIIARAQAEERAYERRMELKAKQLMEGNKASENIRQVSEKEGVTQSSTSSTSSGTRGLTSTSSPSKKTGPIIPTPKPSVALSQPNIPVTPTGPRSGLSSAKKMSHSSESSTTTRLITGFVEDARNGNILTIQIPNFNTATCRDYLNIIATKMDLSPEVLEVSINIEDNKTIRLNDPNNLDQPLKNLIKNPDTIIPKVTTR